MAEAAPSSYSENIVSMTPQTQMQRAPRPGEAAIKPQ